MPVETAEELFAQGNALYRKHELAAAAACYRRALELDASFAPASFNLACALDRLEGPAAALPHFASAAALNPRWSEARANLALALARVGRMAEAAAEFAAAAALKPEDAGIRNDLGLALSALGRGEEAYAAFSEAIRLRPDYPEAHNNLAILFERHGRTSEAIAACREALRLRPDYPEAHNNLANALKSQGLHREAIEHLREALRLRPDYSEARSSLLFALCYPAGIPEEEVAAEHFAFGHAHTFPAPSHENDRSPDRIVNVGYVSADFRSHAVARFIEPVLRHHDRSHFRIFCYSNVAVPDERSETLARLAESFVSIAGASDEAVFELISRDRIDILVDLSGHTADNRLPLFARKPAPVQITWLGYPHTTGLKAIDYRITDAVTDPPGTTERFYAEKLLRLGGTFSCFAPPEEAPEVGALPLLSKGAVTFGSFNNPAKVTPETVAMWAGVLKGVPGSRMLVKGYSLADQGTRDRLARLFAEHGVGPERLELMGNTPSYREHLALYGRVDIALDTFPYHGTTTSCEALWMGVPVVTRCGATHRSRVGASILKAVGLDELVTHDRQEFVTAAVALAQDTERLWRLRTTLRKVMAASRLTDGAAFTAELESAYREVWLRWCVENGKKGSDGGKSEGLVTRGARPSEATLSSLQVKGPDRDAGLGAQEGAEPDLDQLESARRSLEEGRLDFALKCFLSMLRREGPASPAMSGIEETLNRQSAADLVEALSSDARRLGMTPLPAKAGPIGDETLAEAAELLLAANFITPAELICRYILDRHSISEVRLSPPPEGEGLGGEPAQVRPPTPLALRERGRGEGGGLGDAKGKSPLSPLSQGGDALFTGSGDANGFGDSSETSDGVSNAVSKGGFSGVSSHVSSGGSSGVSDGVSDGVSNGGSNGGFRGGQRQGKGWPFATRVSRILGDIALSIGQPAAAAAHFGEAIEHGDASTATGIRLIKAREAARLQPANHKPERFLLIKAWGYGFWSDVNHVLGQCLLAEVTGRTPVIHWGGNSLFSDDHSTDAFESFFEPVSSVTLQDLSSGNRSYYPPKWNADNLAIPRLNQFDSAWSRVSALQMLQRKEDVLVSDFYYAVNDLVPWIPPGHRLHGKSTDQVYWDLTRRYLRVRPEIARRAEAFYQEQMAGRQYLALHVRGGDKGGEDPNLALLNTLYHPEIERYLQHSPQAGLFLMTDDREILRDYVGRYGDRILTTSATRTGNDQGVHYQSHSSRYRLAEEVIVDVLLALRCQAFIGNGLSNVSCAVAQMKEWAPGALTLLGARLDRLRQITLYRS